MQQPRRFSALLLILALLALPIALRGADVLAMELDSGPVPDAAPSLLHESGGTVVATDAPTTFRRYPGPLREPLVSALVILRGPSAYQRLMAVQGQVERLDLDALTPGEAAAAEAKVRKAQDRVVQRAEYLGVQVISRYVAAANGLLIHATASQIGLLEQMSGVEDIEPAPLVKPLLSRSTPHIGAPQLAMAQGFDGTGSVVAIIDTGVDYTHAHFGGPGTAAAWAAASDTTMAGVITDTFEGELLYPTAKMVGGWDFVGPRYNPPHICSQADHEAGNCSNIPEPDPDPLDGAFHGTHVGGIVAGEQIPGIGDGVAPGASLVSLKLYGSGGADEAADVLVDSIEWCARVNLGTETRGVMPPQVDAINISLGEGWAQGSRLFDEAVDAAVGSGVIVVASAGNSGNTPFILGAPSASPRILSVASTVPPGEVMEVQAFWDDNAATYEAMDSLVAPLQQHGRVEGQLAFMGRACNGDAIEQEVAERVALIARGTCAFAQKMNNAQAAGAIGVLMYTDNRGKTAAGGNGAGIDIGMAMIDNAPGIGLRDLLLNDFDIRVVMDPATVRPDPSVADAVSGFSSRGPSKNGALKPDIAAPGSGIVSANWTSGSGGTSASGTSMSGPMVAGAAAVVQQMNRERDLGLGADELGALLMNTSRPVIYDGAGPVPVVRQGAGLVDLRRAADAAFVVRTGDIASLNLGAISLVEPATVSRSLQIKSLSEADVRIQMQAAMVYEEDQGKGLTPNLPEGPILLKAGETLDLEISFELDPAAFHEWQERSNAGFATGTVHTSELDGYIAMVPVDENDEALEGVAAISIPFYAMPRQASHIEASPLRKALDVPEEEADFLTFTGGAGGDSSWTGDVELFIAPPMSGDDSGAAMDNDPLGEDPDEEGVWHELDIRQVGARYTMPDPDAGITKTQLSIAIARNERAATPRVTRYTVYLDTDGDGAIDARMDEIPQQGRMRTRYTGIYPDTGAVITQTTSTEFSRHQTDLFTHLTILSAPIEGLGMEEAGMVDFYVVNQGLNEDWHFLYTTDQDFAPDGAVLTSDNTLAEAGSYRFDPASLARIPEAWRFSLEANEERAIVLSGGPGEIDHAFLAFYPDDRFEADARQMQRIVPGEGLQVVPEGIFLPRLISGEDEG